MPADRPTRAKGRKVNTSKKGVPLPAELSQRLEHLASLPQNWDSYGAAPICPTVIKRAREVLQEALAVGGNDIPLPFIAPSPDGGLELEFETESRKELMLDIPPAEGPLAFLLVEPTSQGQERETEGTINGSHSLEEVIKRLLVR